MSCIGHKQQAPVHDRTRLLMGSRAGQEVVEAQAQPENVMLLCVKLQKNMNYTSSFSNWITQCLRLAYPFFVSTSNFLSALFSDMITTAIP